MLLPAVLLALLLAACGGSTASSGGNGGDESQAAQSQEESEAAEPTPEESEDDDGNGGPGGNGAFDDLDQLAEDLTPPNSDEMSRTEAGTVLFITWESSDSPEDLEGFFEDAIGDTGLGIFSRTSAEGSFSWIFGIEEGSTAGGVLTVSPSGDGSGSLVGLQLGTSE
jgi:hypothetical protein